MATTTTHDQTSLAPQMMRLFHAAGLLNEQDWAAYGEAHERHKPILDVLTKPVSLDSFMGSFKDLLFSEVSLRKTDPKSTAGESLLHHQLSATTLINNEELAQLLVRCGRPARDLLAPLRRDGTLTEADAQRLEQEAAGNIGELIGPGGVQSEMVHRWLGTLESGAMREAALYLALYAARENRLLPPAELNRLLPLLAEGKLDAARKQAVSENNLTSQRIIGAIENGMHVPQVRLDTLGLDAGLMGLFPENLIRRQMLLPLGRTAQYFAFATSDPLNITQAAFLRWATGLWPEPAFSTGRELIDVINEYYSGQRAPASRPLPPQEGNHAHAAGQSLGKVRGSITSAAMADEAAGSVLSVKPPQAAPPPAISDGAPSKKGKGAKAVAAPVPATAPVTGKNDGHAEVRRRFEAEISDNISAVQLVSSLIESAIELRTTDIHIEPVSEGLVVRFRIDGELHRIMGVPAGMAQAVISRIKVLAEMDVTERRRSQDGHFELKLESHKFDFRISTLPALFGEKIVIRILDTAQIKTGMEELGLLPKQRQMVDWMLGRQHGMILVTGPTGSGKTSTLYAALNKLNSESRNLVTIEDPVEYQLPGVNQVQVNVEYGLSFSDGLRSILRQDPDIIMVGEIRDADTAQNAIRAATTGHLVLSTLHTNSALGTLDALTQMGAQSFILAHALLGIIAQRLVRKLCPNCRKGFALKEEMALELGMKEAPAKKRIYKAAGCEQCIGTGYLGRSGVFEVIQVNDILRKLIAAGARQEVLEQSCREQQMLSIQQAGIEKVLSGETSAEEIIRKILLEM